MCQAVLSGQGNLCTWYASVLGDFNLKSTECMYLDSSGEWRPNTAKTDWRTSLIAMCKREPRQHSPLFAAKNSFAAALFGAVVNSVQTAKRVRLSTAQRPRVQGSDFSQSRAGPIGVLTPLNSDWPYGGRAMNRRNGGRNGVGRWGCVFLRGFF